MDHSAAALTKLGQLDVGQELQAGLAVQPPHRGLGVRTQLVVAREDPDGYTLLWRHAAREPMFAAYAASSRETSIEVVRQLLHLDSGDVVIDRWKANVLFSFLVDATLAWLDDGDPARDADYTEHTTAAFWALLETWRS